MRISPPGTSCLYRGISKSSTTETLKREPPVSLLPHIVQLLQAAPRLAQKAVQNTRLWRMSWWDPGVDDHHMISTGRFTSGARPRVHYYDLGDGPALLLINGMAASGLLWHSKWLDRLASSFRLLAVDNRGTGLSPASEDDFSINDMGDDVLAVLDDCGLAAAHVFGHSMGGLVAQAIAIDHPDRVHGLVLSATQPGTRSAVRKPPEFLAKLPTPLNPAAQPIPGETIWHCVTAPGFALRHPEVIDELISCQATYPTPPMMIRRQVQASLAFDPMARLGLVRAPTMVLHGEADPQVPVGNGELLARSITGARLEVLAGVGHLVCFEAPSRSAELVEEFLVSVDRSAVV